MSEAAASTRGVDLAGKRFGRLSVLRCIPGKASERQTRRWFCVCDCGKTSMPQTSALTKGSAKSCGCLAKEHLNRRLKHGNATDSARTITHKSWVNMRSRCSSPTNTMYHLYGGRGISICQEWLQSFEAFLRDMGDRPSPNHSLERNDANGNYEPKNCFWATPIQQANNRRTNLLVCWDDHVMTFTQAARHFGVPPYVARSRKDRLEWPISKCLTDPYTSRPTTRKEHAA